MRWQVLSIYTFAPSNLYSKLETPSFNSQIEDMSTNQTIKSLRWTERTWQNTSTEAQVLFCDWLDLSLDDTNTNEKVEIFLVII